MGTSLGCLRRAGDTLVEFTRRISKSKHTVILRYHKRILCLLMSQVLEQHVAVCLARVMYWLDMDSILEADDPAPTTDVPEPASKPDEKLAENAPEPTPAVA